MEAAGAKAFVAVLSTEVLVIGKTTFTELRMLRNDIFLAANFFYEYLWFFAEFFCKRPKDLRQIVSQIRQLRGNQRISNAKLFNLECPPMNGCHHKPWAKYHGLPM